MNKELMKRVGFSTEVGKVEEGKCPFCLREVDAGSFRDRESLREYMISGLCQECQDKVFGRDEDDDD